nr:MAG TPA: hypothetical protein [Caudoviricetes sp.]
MDAKELNETATKLYEKLRELSQEKLSRPIPVKRKTGDEKSRGFGISNYRDLLWLPVGTLLYADNDYFMKKSTVQWVSTFRDRPLDAKELFAVFVSLAADDFPVYFAYTPDTFERA